MSKSVLQAFEEEFRFSRHHEYALMAMWFNKKLCKSRDNLRVVTRRIEEIQQSIVDDTTEETFETEEYKYLRNQDNLLKDIDRYCTSVIVFSALAVEAHLYDIGARKLGDGYMKDHLDKLDITSKAILIFELVTKKNFPKDGQLYQNLKKLQSDRNKLVHFKSKHYRLIDLRKYGETKTDFIIELMKQAGDAIITLKAFDNYSDEILGAED